MEDYQVADADTPLPTLVGPGNFCVAVRNPAVAAAIADELNRLRAEVERYRSILSILEDEVYASASRVLPPTAVQSDEFNTLDVSDVCNRLVAEVERLREERRWIPVGERLPGSGRHLVTDGSIRWTAFWYDDCWTHNEPTYRQQPTHWMPLPATPVEEE